MTGIRPFTRRQMRENDDFLEQLRRCGKWAGRPSPREGLRDVWETSAPAHRLAARAVGAHRAKFTRRRNKHAAFAAQWEAALAACHAALKLGGGPRPPEGKKNALATQGGEPTIVRLKSGRLQLRLAPPGRMTRAAEQAFFRALAASANVRLSAAAAGFSYGSFYYRKYTRPAFAREMRLALKMGWDRVECIAVAARSRPACPNRGRTTNGAAARPPRFRR